MNKGLLAVLVGLTISGSAMAGTLPAPAGWQSNPLLCPSVKDFAESSAALKAAREKLEAAQAAETALDKALAEAKENEVKLDKLRAENPSSPEVAAAETASDNYLKTIDALEKDSDKKLADARKAVEAAKKEKAADRKEVRETLVAFVKRAAARAKFSKEARDYRKAQREYFTALRVYGKAAAEYYVKCTDKGDK